ncbi:MAG: hypothetical protein EBY32_11025 [Proteobacteria bacterium]|nr:hypothetical protein [Pseudomonadota bacterium]
MTESERSEERLLQAARRVSAANQFAGYTGELWEWPCDKDGQRGIAFRQHRPPPLDPPAAHAYRNDFANPETPLCG